MGDALLLGLSCETTCEVRRLIVGLVDRGGPWRQRQLALAHALRRRLDRGKFADFADIARQLDFTRVRATQLMDLLLPAPEVRKEILFL